MQDPEDLDAASLAEIEAELERELSAGIPVSADEKDEDDPDLAAGVSLPASAAPRAGSGFSKANFAEAREMWESGKHTLKEIAGKIGVSPLALQRRF